MNEITLSGRSPLLSAAASMRPRQWAKNLFIFAPIIFSKKLSEVGVLLDMIACFCLFCLLSGGVYILNDIFDLENDRRHPKKALRPIASGSLPVPFACAVAVTLALVSVWMGFWIKDTVGVVLLAYLTVNLCYSLVLKHVVIVDAFAISAGFLLRILAGISVAEAQTSEWVYIAAVFLTLFLAFGKRRAELDECAAGREFRKVLGEYNQRFLDCLLVLTATGAILSYTLYTISDYARAKFGTSSLAFTGVFVLYGLLRYFYLLFVKGQGDSPADILLTDRSMLINVLLWACATIGIIYH
jgi:4-hydroxybenzoate polyprenyltransferase